MSKTFNRTPMLAIIMLAGCGGGGGGGASAPVTVVPAATPTPTPTAASTPTATVTPTPTATAVVEPAAANASVVDMTASQSFAVPVAGLQYSTLSSTGNGTVTPVSLSTATVFSYDAASRSYRFDVPSGALAEAQRLGQDEGATFTQETIVEQNARTVVNVRQSTLGGGQQVRQTLVRLNAGSANPDLATLYASFGSFEYTLTSGTTLAMTDYRPFAYGIVTPVSGLPTTGSVTYTGIVTGRAVDASDATASGVTNYEVTGQITLVVDYATRIVTGTIAMRGQAIGSQTAGPISLGTLALTSSVLLSGARFEGAAGGAEGSFAGFLAGPAAQEAGLTILSRIADPNTAGRFQRVALSGAVIRQQ